MGAFEPAQDHNRTMLFGLGVHVGNMPQSIMAQAEEFPRIVVDVAPYAVSSADASGRTDSWGNNQDNSPLFGWTLLPWRAN